MTEMYGRVTREWGKTTGSRAGPAHIPLPRGQHPGTDPLVRSPCPGSQASRTSQGSQGSGTGQPAPSLAVPAAQQTERDDRLAQRLMVLALLAAVIMVDQVVKWWAWRYVPGAKINPGGDFLTGPTVGRWYVKPVPGAVLDLVDTALVIVAATLLTSRPRAATRRPRAAAVTVSGSIMVGGWASNLLDRLGMHYWTAPGSIRGVVDFISIGGHRYNVADLFIMGATPLFLLAAACLAQHTASRSGAGAATPVRRVSARARAVIAAVASAALIVAVALGAAHSGKLIRPSHASRQCCQQARLDHR